MLSLLRQQMSLSFSRIVTGDESWFLSLYQSDHMFTASPDEVIPRTKQTIGARKVMVTIFFAATKLVSLNALPPGGRFTQYYFINTVLPDIVHERGQILRRVRPADFFVHMDNSMCHNGRKVTDELENLKLDRVAHTPYSLDLSPCDFWLFGRLKQNIQDRVFDTTEEILMAIRNVWSEVTFDDLQSVFFDWIQRVEYVIEHEEKYCVN
jgi:histone-lysine N-methyltransferase SETMAR